MKKPTLPRRRGAPPLAAGALLAGPAAGRPRLAPAPPAPPPAAPRPRPAAPARPPRPPCSRHSR